MNLVVWLIASFGAVQVGALAFFICISVLAEGLTGIPKGVVVWLGAQNFILIFALLTAPLGALLRMILGFLFKPKRSVACIAGMAIGLIGWGSLIFPHEGHWSSTASILSLGALTGLMGELAWWEIEKKAMLG